MTNIDANNFANSPVLIADDDADFRQILVRRSAKLGLNVTEVENGAQAIDQLEGQHFDLLIVDYSMPEKTGIEVVQFAKEMDSMLPAIMITGSESLETAVEALRARVFDFLGKPLESLAIFDAAVMRALSHGYLERENARLFAEVQRLANTDGLTGLYNRHRLNEALNLEVERAKRYKHPLSLMLLDLDKFKYLNDSYGHLTGDKILKKVSATIFGQTRKTDFPARYGGDEFIIILPDTDAQSSAVIAKRIVDAISNLSIQGESISISVGISQFSDSISRPEDLIKQADQALYHAKSLADQSISIFNK